MKEEVTIHAAKTNLSKLIRRALAGDEIIIARGKKPLVKLVVIDEARTERKIGKAPDLIEYMSDDFNAPLDDMQEYMK
jgi:antitoxin (DNA-binding transcriptional repressor) of toxin-antitoxin stability system